MSEDYVRLTREQLYEQVWSEPTTHLAQRLGISDVALAKICRKLQVPKPKPGYWQQLRAGTTSEKPPLPTVSTKSPTHVMLRAPTLSSPPRELRPEAAARIQEARDPANHIIVSKRLAKLHPLVEASRKALDRGEADEYGRLHPPFKAECLNIRVSKRSMRRSLLLMDALLKATEARGCSVEIPKQDLRKTRMVIDGETVDIALWEEVARHDNPEPSTGARYVSDWRKWSFTPTGTLVLMIDHYGSDSARKRWKDGKRRHLEEQLNEVLGGLFAVAEVKRVERLRAAEQERLQVEARLMREERARLHLEEEARRSALEKAAKSWVKSQNLRAFVDACQARMEAASKPGDRARVEEQWLNWARQHADRLDPFENGAVETMLDGFTLSATN